MLKLFVCPTSGWTSALPIQEFDSIEKALAFAEYVQCCKITATVRMYSGVVLSFTAEINEGQPFTKQIEYVRYLLNKSAEEFAEC